MCNPLDPKTMKNEGFRPSIYGSYPPKMKVLGSPGLGYFRFSKWYWCCRDSLEQLGAALSYFVSWTGNPFRWGRPMYWTGMSSITCRERVFFQRNREKLPPGITRFFLLWPKSSKPCNTNTNPPFDIDAFYLKYKEPPLAFFQPFTTVILWSTFRFYIFV